MQKFKWNILPQPNIKETQKIQHDLNVPVKIAQLLSQRNIASFEQAKSFFRPELSQLHDPFLMLNMDKALKRILKALGSKENILIYGDYDVDGTTSVAMMTDFLSIYTSNITFYIPDRYKEGYGVSLEGIDFASDNNFSLIIALDCGVTAVDQVNYAKEKGIDFIICDHHLPGDKLPDAILLNPKQSNCEYPYKELCGCGVGFKLIQALCSHFKTDEWINYLDLAAISLAADIVPVTGENRILAMYGINAINDVPRLGIKKLIEQRKNNGDLTISDVVFTIAPRINAAGRINTAKTAVELLLCNDIDELQKIAASIENDNSSRKLLDKSTVIEALEILNKEDNNEKRKSTVVFKSDWNKGVIGIVASRLMDSFYRPTIVLTESNGMLTGSARSVNGFNIYNALKESSEFLEQFGGHEFAAGMTLKKENLESFKNKFEKVVSESITDENLTKQLNIDLEVNFEEVFEKNSNSSKFYRILKQFAPHGPQNMSPIFVSKGVKGTFRIVGEDHLKCTFLQNEIQLDGIAFGFGSGISKLKEVVDICYSIEENHWNGNTKLQLMIKDIRNHNES